MIRIKNAQLPFSLLSMTFAVALIAWYMKPRPVSALAIQGSAPQDQAAKAGSALSKNASIRYRLIDLGMPRVSSFGYAINASGQVVGSISQPGRRAVFLWQAGKIRALASLPNTIENQPTGINTQGYVVGMAQNPNPGTAILWRNGKMERLFADARWSWAQAINDKNQIVGDMVVGATGFPNGIRHAFLWQKGQITDLGTLSGGNSHAMRINARAQIVGTSDWQNVTHGFLWENGKMHDLGTLGGPQAEAFGINDNAQVVGASDAKGGESHAFLWENSRMHDLGSPGPGYCVAMRINKQGTAVGIWSPGSTQFEGSRALVWIDRKMYDLNDLIPAGSGWVLKAAEDINDRGEIVGNGKHNGADRAFLLIPVIPK